MAFAIDGVQHSSVMCSEAPGPGQAGRQMSDSFDLSAEFDAVFYEESTDFIMW